MPEDVLSRYTRPLHPHERDRQQEEGAPPLPFEEAIRRVDGSTVDLAVLTALMAEVTRRRDSWPEPPASDRWLAPRLHWSLRMTRSEAADRTMWEWLAVRHADYVLWRWSGVEGVAENRWIGPIHKQAFARLWWGGELLRNGSDYSPVVRGFVRQDLPNSYLHRPFIRCRSLAQGLLDVAAPAGREEEMSADDVNDLARVVNLATAGSPPEAETGFVVDDTAAYQSWVRSAVEIPDDWERLPDGPPCHDTTSDSLRGGLSIAERCWGYAHDTATARGTRSARRRAP